LVRPAIEVLGGRLGLGALWGSDLSLGSEL